MDFLTVFTHELSPRASATLQEKAAADFLAGEFGAMGYATELQEFTVSVTTSEVLVGPEPREVQNVPLTLSGMGRASGPLVHVGEAREEGLPSEGLEGKIALVRRGDITFQDKVSRVAGAGALAAVVYNSGRGLFRGSLAIQAPIPAVAISLESGSEMCTRLACAEVVGLL